MSASAAAELLKNKNHPFWGVLSGLATGALWGLVFLVPRLAGAFTPYEITLARYSLYGLISCLILAPNWRTVWRNSTWADWRLQLILGLVGNVIYYVLTVAAVQWAGLAPASMIIGTLPVTIALVGMRHDGAVPLSKLVLPLSLIGLGLVLIHWPALGNANHLGAGHWWGILCAVGAVLTWTFYSVANAVGLKKRPAMTSAVWSGMSGIATMAAAWMVLPMLMWLLPISAIDPSGKRDWLMLILLSGATGIGSAWAGSLLWNIASRRLPVTLSGQLIVSETLFALLYGFMADGRWPTAIEAVAILCFTLGVIAAIRAH